MTQPAKVTEPSMEEILASIRRIIADDEAKPPPAEAAKPEKAAAPAAPPKPQAMNDIPPSKVAPAKPAAEKPVKSWLDDNLPGLVERIVKAEIERVSRGGR
ncbi:DUF2497 domain-containing protein [Bradyrhizobium sp. SEMIA]|nr:DUF2497 domain-containing protein [Bradyrhizobium sp. SEMIA]